ncbi:hypothetical protein [Elioraea sp.]|uniref:hypothetical protein n=1 Tax=Elioraea sp. TaxID=2185103 RepID=UPI003F71A6BC
MDDIILAILSSIWWLLVQFWTVLVLLYEELHLEVVFRTIILGVWWAVVQSWHLLVALYQLIRAQGWGTAVVVLCASVAMVIWGSRLTGMAPYVVGRVIGGIVYGTPHPGREGTADSVLGTALGVVLKLAGLIGVVVSVLAGLDALLYDTSFQ